MSKSNSKKLLQLCGEVKKCKLCARMNNSKRVLNGSCGPINAQAFFIGEAPGRLGADGSEIPFHGDVAGDNFERLLNQVGLSRYNIYITNAVLCNPKDDDGNNATPNLNEIKNCTNYLQQQIELVNPKIIVTLGATALKATSIIESHKISLKKDVRKSFNWFNRKLIPLYHPGQRAMAHRSFLNQLADYQFVAEKIRRLNKPVRKVSAYMNEDVVSIVDYITHLKPKVSYFWLHKIFYLIEYEATKQSGSKLTNSYFIRQKDGPYCTDLNIKKLKKYFGDLRVEQNKNKLIISRSAPDLFGNKTTNIGSLSRDQRELIMRVIERHGNKSDSQLKTTVYLTKPMKKIIRQEEKNINLFNSPVVFN